MIYKNVLIRRIQFLLSIVCLQKSICGTQMSAVAFCLKNESSLFKKGIPIFELFVKFRYLFDLIIKTTQTSN